MRVLLINMPWSSTVRPSMGLSLQKGILRAAGHEVRVEYLNFAWENELRALLGEIPQTGLELRAAVSSRIYDLMLQGCRNDSMVDEWMFARWLFGHTAEQDARYLGEIAAREYSPDELGMLEAMAARVPAFLDACLERVDWAGHDIVGFTTTFRQNAAALALARAVKQRHPDKPIVFGGANCEAAMGRVLLRNFSFIDYVASGEADRSFPQLLAHLESGRPAASVRGILSRGGLAVHGEPDIVDDLDSLPDAEFDDYFRGLASVDGQPWFDPRLTLEQSRGCWWGARHHCTFCGLNGQTIEARAKSPARAEQELRAAVARYPSSKVMFTDNIMQMGYLKTLLPALARAPIDGLELFYETKSNLRREQIALMRSAGVTRIQPGIESLSTKVLQLMNKGCTALQNVQCLKWCEQHGIGTFWNILCGFPGETPEDYAGSLELARALGHLPPPSGIIPIRLDRFSPNFEEAEQRGFVDVRPREPYPYIFSLPEAELHELAYEFDFTYAEPRDAAAYTRELAAFIEQWRGQAPSARGELVRVVEGGRAALHDTRWNMEPAVYELSAAQDAMVVFCDAARPLERICQHMAQGFAWTRERVVEELEILCVRRLCLHDDEHYLSVALIG